MGRGATLCRDAAAQTKPVWESAPRQPRMSPRRPPCSSLAPQNPKKRRIIQTFDRCAGTLRRSCSDLFTLRVGKGPRALMLSEVNRWSGRHRKSGAAFDLVKGPIKRAGWESLLPWEDLASSSPRPSSTVTLAPGSSARSVTLPPSRCRPSACSSTLAVPKSTE